MTANRFIRQTDASLISELWRRSLSVAQKGFMRALHCSLQSLQ